jgi:hypothetical protein
MSTNTTTINCPQKCCGGKCGGEKVVARGFGTKAKTVRVEPCSALIAQGWVGKVQLAEYQEQAGYLLG